MSLLFLVAATGCRVVQSAADLPGQTVRAVTPGSKDKKALDPVDVQQKLSRIADEFLTRTVIGIDQLRRGSNTVDQAELLGWKISVAQQTCSIVSGPNAIADLLDMTVFVTLIRASLEESWQPGIFGDSAARLAASWQTTEADLWKLTSFALKPEQQAELRRAIEEWRRQNPLPEQVFGVRAVNFAELPAHAGQDDQDKSASVLSLFMLDPLAGLDPATRELAQTRLFAERALYVAQKMPMVLRWQTELLSLNLAKLFNAEQLITNSTQIAASAERFATLAEKLPGQVSAEREAILKALDAQEKSLTPLVNEMRQTLTAGTQMSTSLNTTITTFDALMKRFGVGETNSASTSNSEAEPFRILDYARTAAQLEATARQLTELLVVFDQSLGSTNLSQLSTRVGPVVQQAQAGGREIVDYAFWKAVLFVAIVLVAALLYRFVGARLTSTGRSGKDPP